MIVGSGPVGSMWPDAERLQARMRESRALRQKSQAARARARATRDQVRRARPQRQVLHDSAFARLQAKQATMAVIEQAKGIIMAQHRCGPEEAFDLLRRASQRANIKAHVLAAKIVEHVASSDNGDNYHTGCHAVPAAGNAGTATRGVMLGRPRSRPG